MIFILGDVVITTITILIMNIKNPEGVVKMEYDVVVGYSNFDSNKKMAGFRKHRYWYHPETGNKDKSISNNVNATVRCEPVKFLM